MSVPTRLLLGEWERQGGRAGQGGSSYYILQYKIFQANHTRLDYIHTKAVQGVPTLNF